MHMHAALMYALNALNAYALNVFQHCPSHPSLGTSCFLESPSRSGVTVLSRQPSSGAFAGLATGLCFPHLMASGSQSPLVLNTTVVEVDQEKVWQRDWEVGALGSGLGGQDKEAAQPQPVP